MTLVRSLVFLGLFGCAAPPPVAAEPTTTPTGAPSAPATIASTASPAPSTTAPTTPAAPSVALLSFERVLDMPTHSLALGKGTRFAALGADAWLDDGKGKKKLPPPVADTRGVDVYFGRDDQPRLMGFSGQDSVYLRWRGGAWQRGAAEIGKLGAGARAPLFGVLGYDDPEVVCKVGEQCIIKRLTGWQTIPAPAGQPRVVLSGKLAFAFEGATLLRLEKDGFRSVGTGLPFEKPSGLWAVSESEIWVSEHASGGLFRLSGGSWKREASPVSGPKGLWATSASDVWLAGDGGAAHYDGKAWSAVRGVTGAVEVVTGRSADEVWLAGKSGVWRGIKR